jgi:hypothetical protein
VTAARLKVSVAVPAFESVNDVLAAVRVITGTDAELDAAKLASPLYCALSERSPLGKEGSVIFALPLLSVAVPSSVCPAWNTTGPVGTPLVEVTVAVRVRF